MHITVHLISPNEGRGESVQMVVMRLLVQCPRMVNEITMYNNELGQFEKEAVSAGRLPLEA